VVLPHAIAYNAPAIPHTIARIAEAMGSSDPAATAYDLVAAADLPVSLRDLGLTESALDDAAAHVVAETSANPRAVDRASVRAMLDDAWRGTRPTSLPPSDVPT
jgi:alcohol dehydrogenase class IV